MTTYKKLDFDEVDNHLSQWSSLPVHAQGRHKSLPDKFLYNPSSNYIARFDQILIKNWAEIEHLISKGFAFYTRQSDTHRHYPADKEVAKGARVESSY